MGTPISPLTSSTRKPRADALRNRAALVDAARRALAASDDGGFSLDAIAREVGVGIGTLYRHFPTREQLIAAAYEAELDDLVDEASRLAERMPAQEALAAWLKSFAQFATTKRGVVEALRTDVIALAGSNHGPMRDRLAAAIAPLLHSGAADGTLRSDIDASDVVILAAGALMPLELDAEQVSRLMGLINDALRAAPSTKA